MRMLEITASNRAEGSLSRSLSVGFIEAWRTRHPDATVVRRDVGTEPPDHPTAFVSAANYTPQPDRTPAMVAALAPSDALIDEFLAADRIVVAAPMYNFTVPSTLKAYLDNVVRVGRTFTFDPATFAFTGLATGKKAVVIATSAGDYPPGTPAAAMDFHTPYLRAILGFVGVTDVTIVTAGNQFTPPDVRRAAADRARAELDRLAVRW
jgi:FMN-dependent NADH-azoreductase